MQEVSRYVLEGMSGAADCAYVWCRRWREFGDTGDSGWLRLHMTVGDAPAPNLSGAVFFMYLNESDLWKVLCVFLRKALSISC